MTGTELGILDLIQKIRTPFGDKLMCAVTWLGNAGAVWIFLAIMLVILPKKRRSGIILITALVIDVILCNGILKNVFQRIRPCEINPDIQLLVTRPTDFSFPSGHTAASFAAVMSLYLAGEKKMWRPALALAILIAFSRMYLYVHYLTDIIGGILTGIFAGYVGYWIYKQKFRWIVREQ